MAELQQTIHNLMRTGRSVDAEQLLRTRLRYESLDSQALELLIGLYISQQRWQESKDVLEELIASGIRSPKVHKLKGEVFRAGGQLEIAVAEFDTAWQLDNTDGAVALAYAGVAPKQKRSDLLRDILRVIENPPSDPANRSSLHFAAGKLADDTGDFQLAFHHYRHANELAGKNHSIAGFAGLMKRSRKIFTRELWQRFGEDGCKSELPVFVVGMPRTGTTLLEQRLALHRQVAGLGELPDISVMANSLGKTYQSNTAYPDSVKLIQPSHPQQFGQRYVDRAASRISGESVVRAVDKNPLNFLFLGLIRLVLPKARIIHVQRNPLDTCLSCYFQPFGGKELGFTYSLESLATFYRSYRRLMGFWEKNLPGQIMQVDYHQLVGDGGVTLRRCVEFLGLGWDEHVAEGRVQNSTIQTPSYWQARQPFYQHSVNRWQNYAPFVSDLRRALEDFL